MDPDVDHSLTSGPANPVRHSLTSHMKVFFHFGLLMILRVSAHGYDKIAGHMSSAFDSYNHCRIVNNLIGFVHNE